MYKRLFNIPLTIPSVINIFRTPPKLSQQCKEFSTRQLLRGYNYSNFISRCYATRIPKNAPKKNHVPATWASLAVFLVAGGAGLIYFKYMKEQVEKEQEIEASKAKKPIGIPAIGGPFDLVDTDGNEVTHESFVGKWLLIYFGFCRCPDICPDVLEKLTNVVEKVNAFPNAPNLQPVFITVDPKRDTKEQIKEYLTDFHPTFIGLTGTEEQIKSVCKAYRIYFSKGPEDEDEDYIVDHTVIAYLVEPNGMFSEYYGQNRTATEMVNSIVVKMTLL